jgi:hypothetical protein
VVLVTGLTPPLGLVLVPELAAVLAAALELLLEELDAPQAPSSSELARRAEIAIARVFIAAPRYPAADPAALIGSPVSCPMHRIRPAYR